MRCVSCNVLLSSKEASRRGVVSGQYLDLCNSCCQDAEIESYTEVHTAKEETLMGNDIYNISDYDLLTNENDDA